jgi:hypothetical protein
MGYCWLFYGGIISHMPHKQQTQALSSTEAEYMAVMAAIQEGLWLCSLLQMLCQPQPVPTCIYVDNAGVITLTHEVAKNHHIKHIDIHYHFCCMHVESGVLCPEWVPSSHNTADMLTKLLLCPSFTQHVHGLALVLH